MKFSNSVEINAPVEHVIEVFTVPENKRYWHDDFVSQELIEGQPGQPGSVSRLKFKTFDLLETIHTNNLPTEYSAEYLTEGICWNSFDVNFQEIGHHQTRYEAHIEYRFLGFFIKIIAFVMPGMFKKQVQISMDKFKAYAESTFSAVR